MSWVGSCVQFCAYKGGFSVNTNITTFYFEGVHLLSLQSCFDASVRNAHNDIDQLSCEGGKLPQLTSP